MTAGAASLDEVRATFAAHGIDHFGVEVTSRCNMTCLMCPRVESQMPELDLPFAAFEALAGLIPPQSLVDLNGWGEPLMHPRLIDMVRLIAQGGSYAGFSTNAQLLTDARIDALLEAGVEYVAFSIDGADQATYGTVRGASFERACEQIRRFVERRGGRGSPQLSLTFVMLRDNIAQVLDMVRLAHRLGVDFIRLKKVDVFTVEDYRQITYDYYAPYDPAAAAAQRQTEVLARAVELGQALGIGVQTPRMAESGLPWCWMEPEHTVFLNSLGQFAPCCILGHGTVRLELPDRMVRFPAWTFGALSQDGQCASFDSGFYGDFMQQIAQGAQPAPCRLCPKVTPRMTGKLS